MRESESYGARSRNCAQRRNFVVQYDARSYCTIAVRTRRLIGQMEGPSSQISVTILRPSGAGIIQGAMKCHLRYLNDDAAELLLEVLDRVLAATERDDEASATFGWDGRRGVTANIKAYCSSHDIALTLEASFMLQCGRPVQRPEMKATVLTADAEGRVELGAERAGAAYEMAEMSDGSYVLTPTTFNAASRKGDEPTQTTG